MIFRAQESLLLGIKALLNDEISAGFKNHASFLEDSVINAVRSRAVTPSPHTDSQVCPKKFNHSKYTLRH